ncbi:MAG TPA: HIT family protein [Xanthomonadaceae bacterium]|nr:HIT family protein [Xanthomonadaceae bacterium]
MKASSGKRAGSPRAATEPKRARLAPVEWQLHPQLAADSHPLAAFALSELRLMDDATYPWLVLVPRVAGARELTDLKRAQRHALSDEIDRASRALDALVRPFKLNVAALGNLVPQLHVHVIARFEDDPAWPAPVWGRVAARPYTPEQLVERIAGLQAALRD